MLEALRRSLAARGPLLERLAREDTTIVRLLHGATEGVPGLTIDRYGPILLLQTWREPLPSEAPGEAAALVQTATGLDLVPVWNHRGEGGGPPWPGAAPDLPDDPVGTEAGVRFSVSPRHRGRDPLLFVDLRAARRAVRRMASGDLLNCFAYTCGVGVVARRGGARSVVNVDFSGSALAIGRRNAALNGFDDDAFVTLKEDFFPAVRQLAGLPVRGRGARRRPTRLSPRTFDGVVLDPPRWARSRYGAVDVVRDYPSLLKPALGCVRPGGFLLATNHVPSVSWEDWLDIIQRCARKAGRDLRDVERIAPDDDIPSPDGQPPLKVAVLRL